ncbi:MAG: hypothetical protein D6785_08625 [Planctomycetota bacterium]|nr:MAG: hypothetical protein D6785_08625 [Planctomycetota bacterium]
MIDILQALNQAPGIKGSMIVTEDGLVVQEDLGPTLDKETVSALSANIIMTTKRMISKLGWKTFKRYILSAAYGRIVLHDLNGPFLVVVTDMNIKVDQILIEIASAAKKFQKKKQISG